jgi:hypothetical protein
MGGMGRYIAFALCLGLASCDRDKPKPPMPERQPPVARVEAAHAKSAPSRTAAAEQHSVAIDIDGDGAADSVRIAPVGEYVVTDGIGLRDEDGSITDMPVNWKQTAIIVKLSSGPEQALNFPSVQNVDAVRKGSALSDTAKGLGCKTIGDRQSLLARGEGGSMLVTYEGGRLIAEPCGS